MMVGGAPTSQRLNARWAFQHVGVVEFGMPRPECKNVTSSQRFDGGFCLQASLLLDLKILK